MNKTKNTKNIFLIGLIIIIMLTAFSALFLKSKSSAYALEASNAYEVKVLMPNQTNKWLGSAGLTDEPLTRTLEGSAYTFAKFKQSFLQNGGFQEGKICNRFVNQNGKQFTWTGSIIPNLDTFCDAGSKTILLTPVYSNEYYVIDYYEEGEMIASNQLIYGDDLEIPEIVKQGQIIVGYRDINTQEEFLQTAIWDLSPEKEASRSFIELEAIYESVPTCLIQLIGFNNLIQQQIFNMRLGDELTGLVPGESLQGKTFIGWFDSIFSNGKEYKNGMTWDKPVSYDNQIIKLYAKYEFVTYEIKRFDSLDTSYPDITYTINDSVIYPPMLKKPGKTFGGWFTSDVNVSYIDPKNCEDYVLFGFWYDDIKVNKNTDVNLTAEIVSLDFYNSFVIGFNFNTYNIKSTVSSLYIKSSGVQGGKLGIGFIIEDRTTPLEVYIDGISFQAFGKNLFHAQDASTSRLKRINGVLCNEVSGDTHLQLYVRGNNLLSGSFRREYLLDDVLNPTEYHSAIIVSKLDIIGQTADANLEVLGGNGLWTTSDGKGKITGNLHGGAAIWGHEVNIHIPNIKVIGGSGGGYDKKYSVEVKPLKMITTQEEYHGMQGRTGAYGGSGRYAFNVTQSINVLYGDATFIGGNGGDGCEGGDGGDGCRKPFYDGGDGGKGGTGGNGGSGSVAIMTSAIVTGNFKQIKGTPGKGADGGKGGNGGGVYFSDPGKPGAPGDRGLDGN